MYTCDPNRAYTRETTGIISTMRGFINGLMQENDELRFRNGKPRDEWMVEYYKTAIVDKEQLNEKMRMIHLHNKYVLKDRLKRKDEELARKNDELAHAQARIKALEECIVAPVRPTPANNSNNIYPVQLSAESIRELEKMNGCGPGQLKITAEWVFI